MWCASGKQARQYIVLSRSLASDTTTEAWLLHDMGSNMLLQDKYTNAFLGFGPEDTNFGLELTKNYGVDSYNLGSGFGHFALALQDVYGAVDSIKAAGKHTAQRCFDWAAGVHNPSRACMGSDRSQYPS